jgi:SAM-dependent methyltransferase
MPVDHTSRDEDILYQWEQYGKGGVGRLYWDLRDREISGCIRRGARVIVDAGCGEGVTLKKLLSLYPGRDISGIDIDPRNIAICRGHDLPVKQGDILALDIPDGSVDCCIMSEVLEHIEDYGLALLEAKRFLKEGGDLIVVFPNDIIFKIARLLTLRFREAFYDTGHLRQLAPGKVMSSLKQLGYRIVRVKNIPFMFWGLSLYCIIVARKRK